MTNKPMLSVELRALLESISNGAYCKPAVMAELRAILDKPEYPRVEIVKSHTHICACVVGDSGVCDCGAIVNGVAVKVERAAQQQGEPVALPERKVIDEAGNGHGWSMFDKGFNCCLDGVEAHGPLYAEQPSPVAVVPDGYCIMPKRLTAENGAKALLLGEFSVSITQECPECKDLDEPFEFCEICDGEGEFEVKQLIPWDKIKYIYSEAVKGLALNPDVARLNEVKP